MFLIFNELSANPVSVNRTLADEKIITFIKTFQAAALLGARKIRFDKPLAEIFLSENYSINDWIITTDKRDLKTLLLSFFKYPYINDSENEQFEGYVEYDYLLVTDPPGDPIVPIGFASAYLFETLAISFGDKVDWQKNKFKVIKTKNGISKEIESYNVFSNDCFNNHFIITFLDSIKQVVLIETTIDYRDKNIHFRDDHGNDKLQAFADKLVKSPYVLKVINSLSWNSNEINFIRRVFPDGIIHLRLHWEKLGLGMAVQTTGRNLRETEAIAKIIEDKYT